MSDSRVARVRAVHGDDDASSTELGMALGMALEIIDLQEYEIDRLWRMVDTCDGEVPPSNPGVS